jgi:hypothetical protein
MNKYLLICFVVVFIGGCTAAAEQPSKTVYFKAVPVPEVHGSFVAGKTSSTDANAMLGTASGYYYDNDAKSINKSCDRIDFYDPRQSDLVYIIKIESRKGQQGLYKFAPSNGAVLALCFSKDKFIKLL